MYIMFSLSCSSSPSPLFFGDLIPNSMACLFDYVEWDADLATEAYRQQVEALAHHQVGESSGAT